MNDAIALIRSAGQHVCAQCAADLPAGTHAHWDADTRTVLCDVCAGAGPTSSTAGASARREHERRRARREQNIRSRHPKLGGLLLAITADPTSTKVWEQGARGEEAVGAALDCLPGVITLHDRRMIGVDGRPTRANIDHLVVAASGVWVVDAKTHAGPLEVRRSGGILPPRVERLFINGRDRTHLIDGVHRQVETVGRVLADTDIDAPVHGALCFVGTTLPWVSESIAGMPLVGRRALKKLLQRDGSLTFEKRGAVAVALAARFVPA